MSPEKKERFPFSVSVAVIPFYKSLQGELGILLGTRREDSLITPIGGGMEQGELPIDALNREWREETSLPFTYLNFLDQRPVEIVSPGVKKTSLGLLYFAQLTKEIGLPFYPGTSEISQLNLYTPDKIQELLLNTHRLYRPDLNHTTLHAVLTILSPIKGISIDLYQRARDKTLQFACSG